MEYGLYLHIPYCRSRCRYCDFHTQGGAQAVPESYINALLAALEKYRPRGEGEEPLRPVTVYFGGGTPGLLSANQVKRLLNAACPLPGAEITLEVNPEGATREKLAGFRQAGVNRLSLGVQTARDNSLRTLGRPHTAAKAREALCAAGEAGFQNISGDIMLALPGYSREEFDETLALLQQGGVSHISAYLLKLEENTPFGQNPPKGLPTPDEAADFYLHAARRLKGAGYHRYEISNFAAPGRESRHNLLYWDCGNYLGLGPAAHSSLNGRRFSFSADTGAFLRGECPVREEGPLDAEDYLMLRLRLEAGVSESELEKRFGRVLSEEQTAFLKQMEAGGLAKKTPEGWALTGKGMLVQNSLLARLLEE